MIYVFSLCSKYSIIPTVSLLDTKRGRMALTQPYTIVLMEPEKIRFHRFFRTSHSRMTAWLVNYEVLKRNNVSYIVSVMDSVTSTPQRYFKATSPCNTIRTRHDASLGIVSSLDKISVSFQPFSLCWQT